jgi:hypothetical protein
MFNKQPPTMRAPFPGKYFQADTNLLPSGVSRSADQLDSNDMILAGGAGVRYRVTAQQREAF